MILVRLLLQTVVLALGQIWANKTRAILTSLGIIIGVGSVTAVIASLTGLKQFVLEEFETFGAKTMFIDGQVPESMRNRISWRSVQLTIPEIRAIQEHAPAVERITPRYYNSYAIRNGELTKEGVLVMGIWPEWHEITDRHVILGRQFNRIDEEQMRYVCIVNDQAIEELNLDRDPVGDYLLIDDLRFLIVGVVETKQLSPMFGGGDVRSEVFTPLSTSMKMDSGLWIRDAFAQMADPKQADEAEEQIRFVLRKLRGLEPGQEDTFIIFATQQAIDQFNGLAAGMTAVAGGIVSISLLVGGIGIMNIMLVSVSERTREIGLRKAVGARPAIILMQFLVEAVTLCAVGGLIGLVIGQSLTLLLQNMPDTPLEHAEIPPWAIALAFAFSAAVGVIFGMFPAVKAARLDPIEALRHE
ncbi:MAG: FtsX-like permease family protein [Planctomycetota bacterium]|nr:MAG: FtsX-like permease family protein [Planctomycetota bacterium]